MYSLCKHFILASLCLFLSSVAIAQSTSVTGQVIDGGGQQWQNGTFSFTFVPNRDNPDFNRYSWTGGVLTQFFTGLIDATGNYAQGLPSNTSISPVGSQWKIQVCSGTTPTNCFTQIQVITGGTQVLNVTPPVVVVPPGAGNSAYLDSEVQPAIRGSLYFNLPTSLYRVCTIADSFGCTTWAPVGAGSVGTVTGSGTANAISKWTGLNSIGNSTVVDDGASPTLTPNGVDTGLNGIFTERVVDAGGVIANKLACRSGIVKAQTCAAGTTSGVLGVAQSTIGAGGTAKICWAGKCNVTVSNNFTAGNWLVPSATVAGAVDDTGSATQPTTGSQTFLAESTGLASGVAVTTILSPDTVNASSSGLTNPMTTLADMIIEGAVAPIRLAGPTTPNGVPQYLSSTPSGGVAQAEVWLLPGITPNPQTGTTYTVLATDRMKYLSFSNAGAIAVTLPQAGTAGFTSGFSFFACAIGAGTATITPTTSTISYSNGSSYTSGASNIPLATGQCVSIYSDNSNYFANLRAGGNGTVTSVTGTSPIASSGGATPAISINANGITATQLATQYAKLECSPGLGDGLNAIPAGTYLQFNCVNRSGVTWTITGINCWTDNAGTSTLNAANNAATGLLTGAVTCGNTKSGGGASGTQSATTTLANNDAISFTFVSDGASKQTTWTVSLSQ